MNLPLSLLYLSFGYKKFKMRLQINSSFFLSNLAERYCLRTFLSILIILLSQLEVSSLCIPGIKDIFLSHFHIELQLLFVWVFPSRLWAFWDRRPYCLPESSTMPDPETISFSKCYFMTTIFVMWPLYSTFYSYTDSSKQ